MNMALIMIGISIIVLAFTNLQLIKRIDQTEKDIHQDFGLTRMYVKEFRTNDINISKRIHYIESKYESLRAEMTDLKERIK